MEKEIDKLTLIADKSKAKKEIQKEKERLKKYILSLPDAIQNINEGLLEMAAFNKVISEYLEEYILEYGVKEQYINGKDQTGYKDSIEFKSYNIITKNYLSIMRIMNTLLSNIKEEEEDPLGAFDNEYKD